MDESTLNYKYWSGTHVFFFRGRIIGGPHWYKALCTALIFLGA